MRNLLERHRVERTWKNFMLCGTVWLACFDVFGMLIGIKLQPYVSSLNVVFEDRPCAFRSFRQPSGLLLAFLALPETSF